MKKLFIIIIAVLLPKLTIGQTQSGKLIAEKDWTDVKDEELPWIYFFGDDYSGYNGIATADPDGIALNVNEKTGDFWHVQARVLEGFDLEASVKYSVVVIAKLPSNGQLQINMGDWGTNTQYNFPVEATGDFQKIVCEFPDYGSKVNDAHVLLQFGDFLGTSIVKQVRVYEGDAPTFDKWLIAGDRSLLGVDWDYSSIRNRMWSYDDENYILTKKNLMLSKGTYEFKVFNNIATDESYPSSNTSLVIDENAIYTVDFTFNTITKEVSATATKTDGIFYNYITKGKIAEVIQHPNKYKGTIIIPEKVTHEGEEYTVKKINDEAFSGCSGLNSVTIPGSVTSIGNYAFSGCSGLTSITIPNDVTSIGSSAFQNCTTLTSITISTSLSSIEDWTFYNCTSLSSITIPNSVTSIGGRAFSDCTNLSSIAIPSNVSSIGSSAFYNCSGLSSITIPNSVTSIGTFAFFACTSLSSITIPNNLSSIRGSAFKNCTGLTSITIPNSVTSIGSSAFYGCTSLSSITVGDKVSIIYDHAFANCQNLSDIYCLAENVPSTDASVFDGSYVENATLHVPTSVLNAYKTATPWSGFGEFVSISGEEMPKCATPTISYEGGKIKFNCETEGVEYVSEVSSVDAGNNNTDEVDITGKITVKVYATKSGYVNSDTATAVIEVPGELKGDLNNDGKVNVADHVELTKIIMNEE